MIASPRPATNREFTCGRVKVEILDRLRQRGYSALWDVTCDVHDGTARLLGRLPSHYLKQVAQSTAAEVAGVRRVVNLIVVAGPAPRVRASV